MQNIKMIMQLVMSLSWDFLWSQELNDLTE